MSYIKTIWKARKGINKNRFEKSEETNVSVNLTNAPTSITEPGTPFNIENMNNIEQGIYDAHEMIGSEAQSRTAAINDHNSSDYAHAEIRNIINNLIGLPLWNPQNHILTFTAKNGETLEVDLPL